MRVAAWICSGVCMLGSVSAHAVPVTWLFSGQVGQGCTSIDSQVKCGAPYSGWLTFDPDAPPDSVTENYSTFTTFNTSPYGLVLSIGGHVAVFNELQLWVHSMFPAGLGCPDSCYADLFSIHTPPNPDSGGGWGIYIDFLDRSGTGFDSPHLPTTPPDPSLFNSSQQIDGWVFNFYTLDGTYVRLFSADGPFQWSLSPIVLAVPRVVPEPSALSLFGLGMLGFGLLRRRRDPDFGRGS